MSYKVFHKAVFYSKRFLIAREVRQKVYEFHTYSVTLAIEVAEDTPSFPPGDFVLGQVQYDLSGTGTNLVMINPVDAKLGLNASRTVLSVAFSGYRIPDTNGIAFEEFCKGQIPAAAVPPILTSGIITVPIKKQSDNAIIFDDPITLASNDVGDPYNGTLP